MKGLTNKQIWISIIALNILDIFTTYIGIYVIGGYSELNPFAKSLFNNIGFWQTAIIRMVFMMTWAYFAIYISEQEFKLNYLPKISLYTFMICAFFVVTSNIIALLT